jgi:hypothetical protein
MLPKMAQNGLKLPTAKGRALEGVAALDDATEV